MKTQRLMLDVDGVLADSQSHFIAHLNRQGFEVSLDDITAYNWGRLIEKTRRTSDDLITQINQLWQSDWDKIQPMTPNLGELYRQLCVQYGEVHVVTANPTDAVPKWLKQYGIRERVLHHRGDKTELKFDMYVEDNPNIAPPEHAELIIYDRPWNREIKREHRRIYCLNELIVKN
jgi:phosphoglycolate phosphatase-like HAD superfamily hydrolase